MTRAEYLFDVKLFASFRVPANSEVEARRMLTELMDCASINVGALPDGSPLIGEGSTDGEAYFVETFVEEIQP